ncbi:MAG: DUF3299 domain-containing protein [Campylobacterales bacterium]|nr:DUF3299 domain-containing protein [Campylobacterales bacterium]
MKKIVTLLFNALFFIACLDEPKYEIDNWSVLIDPSFNQEKVVAFYKEKIAKVKENSNEESHIYAQLQEELKKAGNNRAVDGKRVKLEGYLVPIETEGERVSKFLFFPNQAACIHVPASPANQTILVTAKKDEGILMEDAYEKITLYGTIYLETVKAATGTASFIVKEGITHLASL